MSTKVIIDSKAAITHYNKTHLEGDKMNQKKLCSTGGFRVATLINLQKEATAACEIILKIKEITGAPLNVILKEVPVLTNKQKQN